MPLLQEDKDLPHEIYVGHRKFVLVFCKAGDIESDGEKGLGLASWNDGTIKIEQDLDSRLAAEILLHETMHMYWELLGMKSRASEESAVNFTGRALAMLFQQNEKFTTWIRKALV